MSTINYFYSLYVNVHYLLVLHLNHYLFEFLCDFAGGEELSFEEGQIIKILSRCAHSIDDGWWQGELDGHIGNFPSLVVEECDEFGEPLVNEWDETPPQSAPPVFTPPDIPEYLADAEEGEEIAISSPPLQPPPPAPPLGADDLDEEAINEDAITQDDEPEEYEEEEETAATQSAGTKNGQTTATSSQKDRGFAMSLSRDQQFHYGSQFDSTGADIGVPSE